MGTELSKDYSLRRACMGSMRLARAAGSHVANGVTSELYANRTYAVAFLHNFCALNAGVAGASLPLRIGCLAAV